MTSLSPDDLQCVDALFKDLTIDCEVPRLKALPDPLQFYREFVAPNRPCIIEVSAPFYDQSNGSSRNLSEIR